MDVNDWIAKVDQLGIDFEKSEVDALLKEAPPEAIGTFAYSFLTGAQDMGEMLENVGMEKNRIDCTLERMENGDVFIVPRKT